MAAIKPFKGIRYNQSAVKDLGKVITPPYDVIDSAEQERLHLKNPYNIIRLEYGKSYPGDNQSENRYTRAAATFRQWLEESVLQADPENSFYLYEQSYNWNGKSLRRRGVIAALKLVPYKEKVVLRHELTMAGPKADRMELLRALRTNVSPIFTLFPDPEKRLDVLFSTVDYNSPAAVAHEESGQTHRLWSLTDPGLHASLVEYLAPQPLLIADGHHRYETALSYHLDRQNEPESGYVLTIMVSMQDPGLLVLPTHRLLSGLTPGQKQAMSEIIEQGFEVIGQGNPAELDRADYLDRLYAVSREKGGFGLITAERACLLIPKVPTGEDMLPVALLHDNILKPLLAPEDSSDADKKMLSYPHDLDSAVDAVVAGSSDAAFILEPVAVDKVLEHARQGKVMPQKSTFFYPKLPSGLVLYSMDLS